MYRGSSEAQTGAPLRGEPWPEPWTPGGVVAALEPLVMERRRERIQSVLANRLLSVTVVMDAPHDPHNGSAIVRSCEAFGVQRVHVVERVEEFLIAERVTRGTQHWVDRVCHQTPEAAIGELAKEGYELVATDPAGPMLPHDLTLVPKLALVLGNERDGICETLRRAARRTVRIPMRGFVESLNVSVSAAILLHAATEGRPGDLPESDRLRLYARGLHGSVARADDVLRALPPC